MMRTPTCFRPVRVLAVTIGSALGCAHQLDDPERFRSASTSSGGDCSGRVAQLFSSTCATAGCHSADNPAQQLDLASPNITVRLARVAATGAGCTGVLVDPGHPETSILYGKLTNAPPCGARMPFFRDPIAADQLACVSMWIRSLGGTDASTPDATPTIGAGGSRGDGGDANGNGGASASGNASGGASAGGASGAGQMNAAGGANAGGTNTGGTNGTAGGASPDAGPSPTGSGLLGEYFDAQDFTDSKFTRTDPVIDFKYTNTESPDARIASDGTFSVRWTGFVTPAFGETYTVYTTSDDGVKLTLDGRVVIDNETRHGSTEDTGTITVRAGQKVGLVLEWYNGGGSGQIRLSWASPSQPKQVIPQSRLSH